jgi:prepilin-type N-terminal cleavage/methylation domain-containing protein
VHRNRRGFSLVEVLVALVIVAVAVAMFGYFGSGFRLTRTSQIDTQAQAFARSYFDTIRADWSQPVTYSAGALPNLKMPDGYNNLAHTLIAVRSLPKRGVVLRRLIITFDGPDNRKYRFANLFTAPPLQ